MVDCFSRRVFSRTFLEGCGGINSVHSPSIRYHHLALYSLAANIYLHWTMGKASAKKVQLKDKRYVFKQ